MCARLRSRRSAKTRAAPGLAGRTDEGWEGELLRVSAPAPAIAASGCAGGGAAPRSPCPPGSTRRFPDLPDPPRPLTPSRPSEPDPATLSPLGEDQGWRYQRGRVIHHLLEMLPQLPREARLGAAETYVARRSSAVPTAERDALARDVTALLDAPDFAAIFGPAQPRRGAGGRHPPWRRTAGPRW